VFDDLSTTEIVDGFVIAKDQDDQLVTLNNDKKGAIFVSVKSNNLSLLNDFFKYSNFINATLNQDYVLRAKDELGIIESRFKDLSSADTSIVQTVLSIDRYIVAATKGENVLSIQRPSMPKKISPKASLTLALSILLGGALSVCFVMVRAAIRKRQAEMLDA
jgi:hypothetical protein